MTAYAELCQIFASESAWQFDPGWPAAKKCTGGSKALYPAERSQARMQAIFAF